MKRGLLLASLLALLAPLALPGHASAVGLQPVGTFSSPIYVTAPPGDPRLFVVERAGTIQVVKGDVASQFLDIHTLVQDDGERGLLSMAFDPNYASNGLFYVFFNDNGTAGAANGDIHIDEFKVSANPDVADPGSRRQVLTLARGTSASNHNGGQLQFGPDGMLYISVGDAANGANAQSLANPHGKILRIDPHGAGPGDHIVPADNPFVGTPGAVSEIWSLGLRNPYRFSFDHLTSDLVIGDVGAGTEEEIDFAPAVSGRGRGANFGWPSCEGLSTGGGCSNPAFTRPVLAYTHSPPCDAIIGGYVYRGSQVPELFGRYVYTDLCHNEMRSNVLALPLATGDGSLGFSAPSSPVSFGEDATCGLYLASAGTNTVQRIVGSGSANPAACQTSASQPHPAKKKCKKKKKKHRAADAKKHKKKHCKKKKKRK